MLMVRYPICGHGRFSGIQKWCACAERSLPNQREAVGLEWRLLTSAQLKWCGWSDSNRHVLLRRILNPLRLPFRHIRAGGSL